MPASTAEVLQLSPYPQAQPELAALGPNFRISDGRVDAMIRHAHVYQNLGLPVFLVDAKNVPVEERGVYSATLDGNDIALRIRRKPWANIAARLGGRFLVLDVDVNGKGGLESLARLQADFGPLPLSTWTVRTKGGGFHYYFQKPEALPLRNRVNLFVEHSEDLRIDYPGLDIRTTGGSACLPPSCSPTGAYTWLVSPSETELTPAPEWFLRIIDPPPIPRPPRPPLRLACTERAVRYVTAALDRECQEIATTANGGRNHRLFVGAARLGELVGAGILPQSVAEEALFAAGEECGLVRENGARSVRQTVTSGLRRGTAKPRAVEFANG